MRASCGCNKSPKRVEALNAIMRRFKEGKFGGWLWLWDMLHGQITLGEGT